MTKFGVFKRVHMSVLARTAGLAVFIGLTLSGPLAASAAETAPDQNTVVKSEPAANSTVKEAPKQVLLTFANPINANDVSVSVFTSAHKTLLAAVHPKASADNKTLTVDMPKMPKGVYTMGVTSTGDTQNQINETLAFGIDPAAPATPKIVKQVAPVFVLSPLAKVITKWSAFLTVMTMIGALGVRTFVSSPAIARLDPKKRLLIGRKTDRRLLMVAVGAAILSVPALLSQMIYEAGAASKLSYANSFKTPLIRHYLDWVPAGHMWRDRLAIIAVTVLSITVLTLLFLAVKSATSRKVATAAATVGLLGGLAEFAMAVAPATKPADLSRTIFGDILDFGHLASSSLWVGGLIALSLLAMFSPLHKDDRGEFWTIALRRFSMLATICVGASILSGLWLYWVHVGALSQLTTTLYGKTLLVKLILVATLIGIGAMNQFFLLPKMNAHHRLGQRNKAARIATRHFRSVVAFEVALGVSILFVVPFLSSSARNQDFQTKAANLSQTAMMGISHVTLTPSGLQPGLVNYDVYMPDNDPTPVSLAFSSMDVPTPTTTVITTKVGTDHFRATGMYTPMVGNWRVNVGTAGADATNAANSVAFNLKVTAKPSTAKAPAPLITRNTWTYGIIELVGVILMLAMARQMSHMLTQLRIARAQAGSRAMHDGVAGAPPQRLNSARR